MTKLFDLEGEFAKSFQAQTRKSPNSNIPPPTIIYKFGERNVIRLSYKRLGETVLLRLVQQFILVDKQIDGKDGASIIFADVEIKDVPAQSLAGVLIDPVGFSVVEGSEIGYFEVVSLFNRQHASWAVGWLVCRTTWINTRWG